MASQINIETLLKTNEAIVISGIGGRFPESDSMDEFAQNLYSKKDLFSVDDKRWPTDIYDMNQRMAKLRSIEKFDGKFFGIFSKVGDSTDPCIRILLETSYEAICDAGINPQSLRGSDTGVYAGYSLFGMSEGLPEDIQTDLESSLGEAILQLQGYAKCFLANRISHNLDFNGPSLGIDTGCSSSLVALDAAINDMRLGKCQQALVITAQINPQPFTTQFYQTFEMNSTDGICRPWDEEAAGFVRGETVASIFLQKESNAKRIYATVLHSRVNTDGYKKVGMFFPSSELQKQLMLKTCKEANVDPLNVNYIEAHGTGTKVGDLQEARAIYNAYCEGRKDPLPIGLLKSNIGHGEGASGLASIAKIIIAFENKSIPANLNLNKVKTGISEMCPPLLPITENSPYERGIAGLNNFGLGGVNAHVLLEPNYKEQNDNTLKIADGMPRIVNICGRTEESLNSLFDFIEKNPEKVTRDFLALISDTMKNVSSIRSAGFPYRGSMLIKQINQTGEHISEYQYKRQSSSVTNRIIRSVYFLFPGLGGQWPAMAKALMTINIFADKIEECHQILEPFGVDLKHILLTEDKNSMSTMTNKFVSTTAIQIAMFDVLNKLDIIPDGIIGHSFGEIACAYADGCLTTEEAILTSYLRGEVTENDRKIPKGLMAVIGMSWEETNKLCPKGVHVVCNNSKDSVVISGLYNDMKKFLELLNEKNVFLHELQSCEIPYHSQYLISSKIKMIEKLQEVIKIPKERSQKWISTSVLGSNSTKDNLRYASAQYFVHNLMNPVLFLNKLITLPKDAIVIEIGPHSLFSKIISQTLESSSYLSLIKRNQNDTNLERFLTSIGKLYELGLNPSIENLYPKVEWPVARNTQSISSLIKWDHSEDYFVQKFPDFYFRGTASDMNLKVNLLNQDDKHLEDHCIDGKMIFPATGYLMLVWRILAASRAKLWKDLPVVFEDVQFRRATFLSEYDVTKFKVTFHNSTGEFSIIESNNIVCYGRVYASEGDTLHVQNMIYENNNNDSKSVMLDANDVYKELRVRGYDYGPTFRGIEEAVNIDCKKVCGKIKWTKNWVTFMDALLQTQAIALPFKHLFVPVMISSIRCDPKVFFKAMEENEFKTKEDEKEEQVLDEEFEEFGINVSSELKNMETDDKQDEYKEYLVTGMKNRRFGFQDYCSSLPFIADINSKLIVTHGIEVKGLIALPVNRKVNRQNLKLESYQFIANEENDAIDKVDEKEISEYIKVCTELASEAISLIKTKKSLNINHDKKQIEHYLTGNKDEYVLLKTCDKIINALKDDNKNLDEDFDNKKLNELMTCIDENPEFDSTKDIINQISRNERLIRPLLDTVSENNIPKKEIKALEINLSYAIMATEVENYLSCAALYPISVEYTIVSNSIKILHEDFKNKSFKLNEWDHKNSSFPSDMSSVDLIIYRDTMHVNDNKLEEFLQEIYDSIVSKGFLLSVFRYKLTEPEIILNQLKGKNSINNSVLVQRINDFIDKAQKIGFSIICRKSDSIGSIALLFRKVIPYKHINSKEIQMIEIEKDYEKWFDLLKVKMSDNESKDENIWLIANDSSINGIIGLTNCLRLEPGGDKIRCIFYFDQQMKFPINFNEKPFYDILVNDLAINVIKSGKLGTYRHLRLPKNYDQFETNDYFLNCGQIGDLSSFQLFDSKSIAFNETNISFDNKIYNQIRCNVYSSGLNFKDVMIASGRISGVETLLTDCLIGFEFAGRRTDTGERVCGFGITRCMASFVDVREDLLIPIPENWSMDDSVTVLTTYSTVWYGLIERAQLRKNESILIHSGAGGVGQAAIAVCLYYKCDIFTTVGNEEKKKFLMTEYNIPEDRIFSSRDTQFEYKIMSITEGKGVNLVLNSLTGDKLEASFRCVSDSGRFVEIGKYDLQMNKQLGMFAFLRNISFHGISFDRVLYSELELMAKFFDWMHKNSFNGCIKALNKTVFQLTEVEKAFRYMLTGKHIGKIVIKIREEERNRNALKNFSPTQKLNATVKTYFDPKKVYIITGGLGGFGIELCHWMLFKGARKLVLTSRTGLKTNYQKFIINRFETLGEQYNMFESEIAISTCNSNTIEGSQQLLKDAEKLGPIGGVFHLSLVLNDAFYENQTIDTFTETCESKINTFENLDKLSRDLCPQLDYFVVFSSVSCGKGNAGQTNYGFANSIVERICEERRRDGLHGLAIQWGPIGDVGVFADNENLISISGVVKQRINSCLEVLDKFLQIPYPILSSVERANRQSLSGTREERMIGQIWDALGVDPKITPNHLTLGELGMESIVAVELRSNIEREFDVKLSLSDIKHITVKQIKEFQSGNKQEVKDFVEELKRARTDLMRIKFIIPNETHTKLNVSQKGNPIYFLPPIEGIFSTLENLAKNIKRPVIALNWTQDMKNMKTLKDISVYYTELLKNLSPNGNYDIIGHSFGAVILAKMLKKAPIGRAVIFDISSKIDIKKCLNNDEYIVEFATESIIKCFPHNLRERISRDLKALKTIDEKLKFMSNELKEFCGKSLISKDLDEILKDSYRRVKMIIDYQKSKSKKFKKIKENIGKKLLISSGKLLIIKSFEESDDVDFIDKMNDFSHIPIKDSEAKVIVETVNANADQLLTGNVNKIAELINIYMT